ncbi:response regulator [Streptomyces sp. NPDC001262]|uniref:response regulator transcription factor n=1 Tax=Streptomyces TaxID=1883 RepID=UPI0036CA3E3B
MTARVVIVDDHAIVRAGLRMTVNGFPGYIVVGEAADGAEAVAVGRAAQPDLILMDLHMPRIDGLEAARQLLRLHTPPKVVLLTSHPVDSRVLDALQAGVCGFLLKDTPPAELRPALDVVVAGGQIVSADVVSLVLARAGKHGSLSGPDAHDRVGALSRSERRVLELIGSGLSNVQIAHQLHLSVASIKTYVSRLLAKVGVDNRTQAAILAHETGIMGESGSGGHPRAQGRYDG